MATNSTDFLAKIKKLSDTELRSLKTEIDKELTDRENKIKQAERKQRDMEISNVDLSVRLYNILLDARIKHLSELQQWSKKDFLALKNAGAKSLKELEQAMKSYDITLKN